MIPEEELIIQDVAPRGTLLLITTIPDEEATTTPAVTTDLQVVPVGVVSAREPFSGSCLESEGCAC